MPISDYLAKLKEIEKLPSKEEQSAAKQKLQESGGANRMFVGKTQDKKSVIGLNDAKGKTRIEISVEANGNPKINFLDENGKVIYSLPEDAKMQH